ncbi:PIR Superfamily Protein [Plasmodium ovale wallikeri]|uniref:PIR Superfamily Protein n=1 Tax=Plasmodium ovale wallikeri TaxID=864142 RepID=A0A1A9AN55_PLAOA|nr:PIR Superfamily Protein [Plasmodium ovale wallikeri]SBT57627.1 PIR Superfamily Protein [Plasmodium ovale wallikeri]
MATIEERELDTVFNGSDSKKIYNEFSQQYVGDVEKYCEDFKKHHTGYDDVNFCKKFAKNLKEINKIEDESHNNRCVHFKYWVFDELRKKNKSNYEELYRLPFIGALSRVRDVINLEKTKFRCYFNFLDNFSKFIDEKHLHDYFSNYETIQNRVIQGDPNCELYNKYLNYIITLYNEYKGECCSNYSTYGDYDCRNYFKCAESYNPNDLLSNLKCRIKVTYQYPERSSQIEHSTSYKPAVDSTFKYITCNKVNNSLGMFSGYICQDNSSHEQHTQDIGEGSYFYISVLDALRNIQNRKCTEFNDSYNIHKMICKYNPIYGNGEQQFSSERSSSDEDFDRKVNLQSGEDGYYINDVEDYYPSYSINYGILDFMGIKENMLGSNTSRVALTTAIMVAISLVLFMFYKFTPIGLWFRKNVLKQKNMRINYYPEDMKYFSEDDSEFFYMNPRGKGLSVPYNSSEESLN